MSISNVVPAPDSKVDHLTIDEYNSIVDKFIGDVMKPIEVSEGNRSTCTDADYSIEDIIPQSVEKLNSWINGYPLSQHPFDIERWQAFLVSLIINKEELSLEDFSKYLRENASWDEDKYCQFEEKFTEQINLLKYYISVH